MTTENRRQRTDDRGQTRKAPARQPSSVVHRPSSATRTETDTFGPLEVPADRYWGAQTERSRNNFRIGDELMPLPIIRALAIVKRAAAETNRELGSLDARRAKAIVEAAQEIIVAPKIREADIFTDLCVATDLDTQRLNHRDFCPDQLTRQAIARHAGVQHAGRLRFHLKNRGAKSHQGEIVPGSETGRTRADDRDPFSSWFGKAGVRKELQQMAEFLKIVALARFRLPLQVGKQFAAGIVTRITSEFLADEALESADGNRLIDSSPAAGRFAWRTTNTPAERR